MHALWAATCPSRRRRPSASSGARGQRSNRSAASEVRDAERRARWLSWANIRGENSRIDRNLDLLRWWRRDQFLKELEELITDLHSSPPAAARYFLFPAGFTSPAG